MNEWQGFWSYVHSDEESEGGRITRLAQDVVSQFEMLTGESINLFLDKDALEWGENWKDRIDEGLASIAFFIPVMTPRYFQSAECRRELQFFARRATNLGIKELVLPLLYADVAALHDEAPEDDLIVLVKTFQWEDWRDLRFADPASESYRRATARLAERLVRANRTAEKAEVEAAAIAVQQPESDTDVSPGVLDRLAAAEEALPRWQETLQAIGEEIQAIGQLMQEATSDMERGEVQGKGFAARLAVARRTAKSLAEPVDRIWSFGKAFASQLHEVDQGFRTIIQRVPAELAESPDSKDDVCGFFEVVRNLATAAQDGLGAVQGMIDAIAPIESMSRDLRPPLRRLRQGLTIMVEAREVTEDWVRLIEESGVECP